MRIGRGQRPARGRKRGCAEATSGRIAGRDGRGRARVFSGTGKAVSGSRGATGRIDSMTYSACSPARTVQIYDMLLGFGRAEASGEVPVACSHCPPQCRTSAVRPVSGLASGADARASRLPMPWAQWRVAKRSLAYRCGGSVGLSPTSRFIWRTICQAPESEAPLCHFVARWQAAPFSTWVQARVGRKVVSMWCLRGSSRLMSTVTVSRPARYSLGSNHRLSLRKMWILLVPGSFH